jgi:N utilization substance protein B
MLTRRHIRIKVMQSVYSFSQRENGKLEEELKFFDASVSQSFELYTALLGLIKALMDLVQDQLKVHEKIGSVDVKYQHLKLLSNNRVMLMIQQHAEFVFLKELLQKITSDTAFNDYQKNTDPQWEDDLNWFSRCFKKHIASSDFLYDYLEDQNLTWIDDLPLVNTFLSKMFKQLAPDQHNSLPFPEFVKNQEDIVFGRQLLEKVIVKDEELQKELEGKTPNWDPERIARLDGVVLKIAIAELLYFPNIPTKVTLNEYLEIIKDYSTPNSNNFVNGVLDKLVKEFSLENRLNKSGRGLL